MQNSYVSLYCILVTYSHPTQKTSWYKNNLQLLWIPILSWDKCKIPLANMQSAKDGYDANISSSVND
jgi:hypothetical protein